MGSLERSGSRGVDPRIADDQRRPRGGTGVKRWTPDLARLPGAGQRGGKPFACFFESPSFMPADLYLKTRLIHLPWLEQGGHRRDVNSDGEDGPTRGRGSRTR